MEEGVVALSCRGFPGGGRGVGGEQAIGLAEIYPFLRRTGVVIADIIY